MKKKSLLTCLLATALTCGGAGAILASADSGSQVFHDPLINSKVAPDGAQYNGFGWDQDMSVADYCGAGGDTSAFKLDGSNVAYAEYTVSNVDGIEALYYAHKDWGKPDFYYSVDETQIDTTRSQYAFAL